MTMMPINYDDPRYAELARLVEGRMGLPKGILDAIRLRGERSNANQVSEAGARSPYQFIPATRRGMIRNYKVDPWANEMESTVAAAYLLKENRDRFGNWGDAVTAYHGGLDKNNWGPRTRAYRQRVGNFDDVPAREPTPMSYDGTDPLAPLPEKILASLPTERPEPIPSPNAMTPTPAQPKKKRGGILGALGSIFMPEPDSLYAAALRGGIWDAKANQAKYLADQRQAQLAERLAQTKVAQAETNGEYKIAGNNIVHFPADGGEPTIITPPQTMGEKERLIDKWRSLDANDPLKGLLERMLLGSNSDPVLQNRTEAARIRAGATTTSARIRASSAGTRAAAPKAPPAGFILDN